MPPIFLENVKYYPIIANDTAGKGYLPEAPVSLQIQSVLFQNDFDAVFRSVLSIARSAELAVYHGYCSNVQLIFGDSSPVRCLTHEQVQTLRSSCDGVLKIEYRHFNGNRGSALGHNLLAAGSDVDFLLIQNPDIVVSPLTIELLLKPFKAPDIGMTEAKQIPIEHPKEYDSITGVTGWATTACAIIPAKLFEMLGGFDSDSFFLYGDDVDFSWLVREAGLKIVFQPAAVVFHDKRLSREASWCPSKFEHYYSAEAALFLTYKWSRLDLTSKHLSFYENYGDEEQKRAAAQFRKREKNGSLPRQHDKENAIAEFVGDYYTTHRFKL